MSDALFRRKAPVVMGWLMRDFSLIPADAAAILGNIGGESGGFMLLQEAKPMVPGSAGGWGWCQWTGPRRRAFERWCGVQALDPASDEANYGYLCLELRGGERGAIAAVKAAASLADKVAAFERSFERAGIPNLDGRVKWAKLALACYAQAADVPLARPRPELEPDSETEEVPRQAPQPDDRGAAPAPAQPGLFRKIGNWAGGLFTSGGLFYMDWRLGVLIVAAIASLIGFLLWLYGREPIKVFISRHLGRAAAP